jgi:F-type H+-transporting ATPase subunit delta
MVELVAKRYVKALMTGKDSAGINAICEELKQIAPAFCDDKFIAILSTTDISSDQKVELVLSFIENPSNELTNLVKLLGEKKRLNVIPELVDGLEKELAALNNSYTGIVYTNNELSSADMEKLTSQFASKFNVTLELAQNVCDYDGIKVDIDGLGVEIGFSKERLKSQMIEHILKAV